MTYQEFIKPIYATIEWRYHEMLGLITAVSKGYITEEQARDASKLIEAEYERRMGR